MPKVAAKSVSYSQPIYSCELCERDTQVFTCHQLQKRSSHLASHHRCMWWQCTGCTKVWPTLRYREMRIHQARCTERDDLPGTPVLMTQEQALEAEARSAATRGKKRGRKGRSSGRSPDPGVSGTSVVPKRSPLRQSPRVSRKKEEAADVRRVEPHRRFRSRSASPPVKGMKSVVVVQSGGKASSLTVAEHKLAKAQVRKAARSVQPPLRSPARSSRTRDRSLSPEVVLEMDLEASPGSVHSDEASVRSGVSKGAASGVHSESESEAGDLPVELMPPQGVVLPLARAYLSARTSEAEKANLREWVDFHRRLAAVPRGSQTDSVAAATDAAPTVPAVGPPVAFTANIRLEGLVQLEKGKVKLRFGVPVLSTPEHFTGASSSSSASEEGGMDVQP